MLKKNNIIEINGKSYDANTGDLISGGEPKSHSSRSIDDVHGRDSDVQARKANRAVPKPVHSHKPTASSTLMRKALKKPTSSLKRHLKTASPIAGSGGVLQTFTPPIHGSDPARLKHATQIKRSQLISHFPPSLNDIRPISAQPQQPASRAVAAEPSKATPFAVSKPKTTADVLEHAIRHASTPRSTPRPADRSRAKRRAGISASVTVAVALMGFVASQNMSNVKLQVASAKAGFDASLPSYQPAGYSLDKLNYSQGIVSADFDSNSDQRQYHIIQKLSQWDSSALRDNFVRNQDTDYKTEQVAGRTVYLYGQRNVTWVSDGIWYIIQSNGSLSDQQLVNLAKSL